MTVFGAGNGLLSFYADDAAELLRIFDITWIGSTDLVDGKGREPDHLSILLRDRLAP